MKFWAVTNHDASTSYWWGYEEAKTYFDSSVADIEYPTGNEVVELAVVDIGVTSDTVYRLLNGMGGYVNRERILERWQSDGGEES